MGGESKKETTQTQQSTTNPWAPAMPQLNTALGQTAGLLGNTGVNPNENAALTGLSGWAGSTGQFAPKIAGLANDLFAGGGPDRSGYATDAYKQLQGGLQPYATQNTDPYQNEAFTKATGVMSNDIMDRVKSQFAGSGYSPVNTGDFAQQVGRGVSQGIAPTWLQASNDLNNQKLGAISGLYQGGNTTAGLLSGMDQTRLGNRTAGVGVADAANSAAASPFMNQLSVEAQRRGIPSQNLAQILQMILPIAGMGNQSTGSGQSNTTNQMSPVEQAVGWSTAFKNFASPFKPSPTGGG